MNKKVCRGLALKFIYLITETVSRELYANLSSASFFLDRGYLPIILSQIAIKANIDRLKPGIIIDKGYGSAHISSFIKYKALGFYVVILRSEPIAYNRQLFRMKLNKLTPSIEHVDRVYSLGKINNEDLLSAVNADKLRISGNMRFNILKDTRLRTAFLKKDLLGIKKLGSFILIVSNFPNIDIDERYFESESFHFNETEFFDYKSRLSEHRKNVYHSFIEMIEFLTLNYNELMIIYRPHPSENPSKLKKRLSRYSNFKIVYSNTAVEWINSSKVAIQNNCTTSIEAFLMGKPQISYRKHTNEEFDLEETLFTSYNCFNLESLKVKIDKVLIGDSVLSKTQLMDGSIKLSKYISHLDGFEPLEVMLRDFDGFNSDARIKSQPPEEMLFKSKKVTFLSKKIVFKTKRLILHHIFGDMTIQQISNFSESYIEELLKLINLTRNRNNPLEVKEIADEIFLISNKVRK